MPFTSLGIWRGIMSALSDPIFDVTITCRECGWSTFECGDTSDSWYRAVEDYVDHMRFVHQKEEGNE